MPAPSTIPTRRRFHFGLRTLFLLVTISAVPCAWAGHALHWIYQRRDFLSSECCSAAWADSEIDNFRPDAPGALWLFGESGEDSISFDDPALTSRALALFPEADICDGHFLYPPRE